MTRRTSPGGKLMTSLLVASWMVEPALAQTAQSGPAIQAQSPGLQSGSGGVLTPPEHVDPGMTRAAPPMPAQSTPVIHPRRLHKTRHGTVQVVPK